MSTQLLAERAGVDVNGFTRKPVTTAELLSLALRDELAKVGDLQDRPPLDPVAKVTYIVSFAVTCESVHISKNWFTSSNSRSRSGEDPLSKSRHSSHGTLLGRRAGLSECHVLSDQSQNLASDETGRS